MISVIIPSLNEEKNLARLLGQLQQQASAKEIIVIDGQSSDASVEIAEKAGVKVLSSKPGRGRQLCKGVQQARGEILLFLHADTQFPASGLALIERYLGQNANIIGGNFRILFDGDDEFSHWLNGFYARIRRHGFYYGDSGIFVRRQALLQLGGLKPLALMEDYHLVRQLERSDKPTICIDDAPLISSSRRFAGRSHWAIVAGWLLIHCLYYLRVPAPVLSRLYDSARKRQKSTADSGA